MAGYIIYTQCTAAGRHSLQVESDCNGCISILNLDIPIDFAPKVQLNPDTLNCRSPGLLLV